MTCFRKTLISCVFSGGLVAAPTAAWGQDDSPLSRFLSETEFEFEADLDAVAAFGAAFQPRDFPHADLTARASSETLTQSGWRYGLDVQARLSTGDGRRGLQRPGLIGPQLNGRPVAGLLTGLSGEAGLDDASARLLADRVELYVQTRWLKWRAGIGDSAARLEAQSALHPFRLSRAQGGVFDPSGLNLADTRLSLADSAPGLSVQSRRIVGVQLSASFAPQADPCAQGCQPSGPEVIRADLKSVWSVAASFDRRAPSSGVRWSADLGYEHAQADGPVSPVFSDPWLVRADLVRQAGDVSVRVSALTGSDGVSAGDYDALGLDVSYERGDWVYGAELGYGRSELVETETASLLMGASRLVGDNALVGLGILGVRETGPAGDRDSVQLLIETGLRF